MSLESAKIFLCIVISLTTCVCRYTQSHRPELVKSRNVTYDYPDVAVNDAHNYDGIETEIVDKKLGSVGQFPYMAVVHQLLGNGTVGSQCSGSILSKRWVLTAGHCVARYPRRFFVVFGIIDKSGIQYDYLEGPGVSMITTEAFAHPQYTEGYDIGLLHMPDNIPFSSIILPIKLVYHTENLVNKNAHIIGWGKDQTTSSGTIRLKYAMLPIIVNNVCKRFWPISDKHICTAAGLGREAGQGDSGSPLVIRENDQDLQVGIVSYGDAFCSRKIPEVFIRVSSFIDWIHTLTKH